jgi:glyoxylase-like metal-dependent hydrolase (beta-lactamase superfamily II)/rhodanese-related sulfurtransferase
MTETKTQWTAAELNERLEKGEEFFVFDVRNEDEYESWKIEGSAPLPMANVPYYEMLEVDEHDDVVDSFVDFLGRGWADKLPKDKPVLAVCAKGDTSEFVAQAMQKMGFEAFNLEGGTKAWGDYYYYRALEESPERSVYQMVRPARGCLSYVVASEGQAVVIDPLRHISHYADLAEEKGFEIVLILDTHGHADHISGGPALVEEIEVPYFLHPYDGIHPIDVLPAKIAYDYLEDGLEFSVGSVEILTIHIPGHTLGNAAFLLDDRYLFTGDSIFIESIARPDLGGHGDTWAPIHYHSLRKLLEVGDGVVVLPAHFSSLKEQNEEGLYAASIGHLKRSNDGLLMVQKSEEEFVEYILASLPKFPDEYVDIKRVNAGLLEAGETKASELELGKNICALSQVYDE